MCEEKKSGGGSANKWRHPVSLVFRIAGIAMAVAAAAVMAAASQCTVYADYDYGARPSTVTYSDFPAFVYLVAATSIAAPLEAVALFLSVSKKGKKGLLRVLMPLLGAAVPALLYSSAGAAFAAGWDVSYYSESEPSAGGRRFSVCRSSAGARFCGQVHVSMWLALGAAVAVSVAECLTTLLWCHGGGSDSSSHSDSADSVCGHGCHCKH